MLKLNRLKQSPIANTREMRAYMQAILEVTGLYADEAFEIELFMKNYRTHLENGRLSKDRSSDLYKLTDIGKTYFSSRLSGQPISRGQHISRAEVIDMIRQVTAKTPKDGWESFEFQLSDTEFNV